MKKVSILFAMVFAATFAIAQNTADVKQLGDDNNASVTQTGTLHEATVNQTGNKDIATVEQTTTGNMAFVDQINGNENTATVKQTGTTNEAYLTQGMIENYNLPPYHISSNVPSFKNKGTIIQNGTSNKIGEFIQVGTSNTGLVDQDGTNNLAYIYQGWAYGFWGETATTSALSSTNSTVNIKQLKENNDGNVWQYGGDNNKANILQDGKTNVGRIAQGFIYTDANYNFTAPVFNVNNNTATLTQQGDENTAKLFQLGNGNSFDLTQNGTGNILGGKGLSGLESIRNGYFEQDGDRNTFIGQQTNGATLDDKSRQTGNDNYINLSQGEDDLAKIIQQGDLNDVFLTQMGGGQNATILQTGNSNVATVSQQ